MTTITVRGHGALVTAPDAAVVVLACEALRPVAAEALADVSVRMEALAALCEELGIPAASRTTAGVAVAEHGEHDREGRWQHRGYRAESRLRVRVAGPEVVGRLLTDAVERAGARVEGPWWEIAPDNPARLQACRLAAADARARAEVYAAELGVRLGAIVSVQDPPPDGRPEPRPAMRALASSAPELPVEAGEQLVTAAVEIEFALEQG